MKSMKYKIRSSFSRSASTYDRASWIQNLISDKMTGTIKDKNFQRVLEIGSGTGSYTQKLLEMNNKAEFILIDFARPMMHIARQKLKKDKTRIKFLVRDAEKLKEDCFPPASFDMITSNATFQWINDLERLFSILKGFLAPRGVFLFSYFGPRTYYELNHVLSEYYKDRGLNIPAAGFFSKETLENLVKGIFPKAEIKEYTAGKEYKTLFVLLQKIRQNGGYGWGLAGKINLTRKDLEGLEKIYRAEFGKITAAYHYYIVRAEKE